MFDVWFGDVELTTLVLNFSFLVIIPVQLVLCFKVKRKIVRLLPVIIFSIPTIVFTFMAMIISGWDGIGYIFLAIFAGFMLLACGIAWGIWGLSRFVKRKR